MKCCLRLVICALQASASHWLNERAVRGDRPLGVLGPRWKESRLGPHVKCIATRNHKNISYCFKYIDGFVSGRVWDAPGNSLSSVSTLGRQQGSPQWKRVLSHLWDPRSEVRVQWGLERLQRRAFLPFPAPGGSWCPLACGHFTPVPDPTFLHLLLFCLF